VGGHTGGRGDIPRQNSKENPVKELKKAFQKKMQTQISQVQTKIFCLRHIPFPDGKGREGPHPGEKNQTCRLKKAYESLLEGKS